jgi:hypothetical protein
MNGDLQKAPANKVIYLEGKTDTPVFFALLGVTEPRDSVHQGVYVRALKDKSGMGGSSVRLRVELAKKSRYRGIFGVIDGDGEPLNQLSSSFDAPFTGPLFIWKGYAIENLLVKTGWPAAWENAPDWKQVLLDHAPYVALNNTYRDLQDKLKTLRLSKYNRPALAEPLLTVDEVTRALTVDRDLIHGYDVAARFADEVERFRAIVHASVDEGHALVDGKWLTDKFAPNRCKLKPETCRQEWMAHATAAGGLAEVRDFWQRITGRSP